MATAAVATTSLRVASAVFAADFRHPAVLARELASIDQLSEGRLEVGLGAGYQINDYAGSRDCDGPTAGARGAADRTRRRAGGTVRGGFV